MTNATTLGDKNADLYSYGDAGDDTMGLVDKNTKGFSSTTSTTDRKSWESLAEGRAGKDNPVTYRKINAPDQKVEELAKKVEKGHEYSLVPEVQGGTNSNTGAGAVAHAADGGTSYVKNGTPQPGSLVTHRVRFEPRKAEPLTSISDIVAP